MIIRGSSINLNYSKWCFIKYFFYIIIASDLVPYIFCLLGLKHLKSKDIRFFFIYLFNLAFFSISLLIIREMGYKDTYGLKIQTIYPIFETFLIAGIFFNILKAKYKSWILFPASLILAVIYFISFLTITKSLPFLPFVLEEIFFLLVILLCFYEKIKYITETPIYTIPNFWICLGFLIYFSGTFFLFLVSTTITEKDSNFGLQYNMVVACFSIIKNILFCMAIYTNKTGKNSHQKKNYIPEIDFENYHNPLSKPVIFTNK